MAYRVHINIGRAFPRAAAAALAPRPALTTPQLRRLLKNAVGATLAAESVADAELSVTLLDDDQIVELNRQYRQADYATDVLAFALQEAGEPPLGDVYIGWPQALRQAAEHGEELGTELARLAIHGTLHVLGYDHPDGPERTAGEMWRRQERILMEVLGR